MNEELYQKLLKHFACEILVGSSAITEERVYQLETYRDELYTDIEGYEEIHEICVAVAQGLA